MKKITLFLSLFAAVTLACDLSVTVAPSTGPAPLPTYTLIPATALPTQMPASATSAPATAAPTATPTEIRATVAPGATFTAIPATVAPLATATQPRPAFDGIQVSDGLLSLVLSPGLASGARGIQKPRADGKDLATWDVTPGHTVFKLEGYLLNERTQQPQIYVFPAMDYAQLAPTAFESIHRLDNILYGPGAPVSADQLPAVPFFNAKQAFASNIQIVSFQNGSGVRFLTEYAQYALSANNHDLFYHFQGVTRDGAYYIVAILPISNPRLAETSDGGAALPAGGIPYPYFTNPGADMQSYYTAVTTLLNGTSPDGFSPTINKLDLLIQSMRVTP